MTATIALAWETFQAEVLGNVDLPPPAVKLIHDAFYSGAFSCFHIFVQSGTDEETPVKVLRALDTELTAFFDEKMKEMTMAVLKGEQNAH